MNWVICMLFFLDQSWCEVDIGLPLPPRPPPPFEKEIQQERRTYEDDRR